MQKRKGKQKEWRDSLTLNIQGELRSIIYFNFQVSAKLTQACINLKLRIFKRVKVKLKFKKRSLFNPFNPFIHTFSLGFHVSRTPPERGVSGGHASLITVHKYKLSNLYSLIWR